MKKLNRFEVWMLAIMAVTGIATAAALLDAREMNVAPTGKLCTEGYTTQGTRPSAWGTTQLICRKGDQYEYIDL